MHWQHWRSQGELIEIGGVRLFVHQEGRGPELLCFHGFPTSSYDWHRLLPLLADQFRVTMFDFPGYGLSDKPVDLDYSIFRQCDAAQALLNKLGINRFHLLAHDMGTTVAAELLHRLEHAQTTLRIEAVTLLNAGLYMELHQPLVTQRLLRTPRLGAVIGRLAGRSLFMHQYPKVYMNPEAFDRSHYESQWRLLIHNRGRRVLHKIAGYMHERLRYRERWLGALKNSPIPVRLVWGMADRIATAAIAEKAYRELNLVGLERLEGVGHYPQLEVPEKVACAILA